MQIKYILLDSSNDQTISCHRSLDEAVASMIQHRQVINSRSGNITYAILEKADGEVVQINGVNNYGFRFADDEEINCLQLAYDESLHNGWRRKSS